MRKFHLIAAALGSTLLITQLMQPASAHHRSGHAGGPPQQSESSASPQQGQSSDLLDSEQRQYLSDLLQDTNHPDAGLIDIPTRDEIQAQRDSLPPGIQRRLARGRGLPPGIARQIGLSREVNRRIDLSEDVQIIVVGSDVAVVDPVTGLVIDILREILL